MQSETEDQDQGTVESLQDFALRLLDFHGGQNSSLYSVGSCMLAGDDHWTEAVDGAVYELRDYADEAPKMCETWSADDKAEHLENGKVAAELADQLLKHRAHKERLDKLDSFTTAYLECACWLADEDAGSGEYSEKGRTQPILETLHPSNLEQAVKDCAEFQSRGSALLAAAYDRTGYDEERAGHDFFLTRGHAGVGFWDR